VLLGLFFVALLFLLGNLAKITLLSQGIAGFIFVLAVGVAYGLTPNAPLWRRFIDYFILGILGIYFYILF
jgi:hypothetical protein